MKYSEIEGVTECIQEKRKIAVTICMAIMKLCV